MGMAAMALSELQKKTSQAIVNIYETGSIHGDYARVVMAKNDPGHLTYGRSQTTLASGNLYLLIKAYCDAPGAAFATELSAFLLRLETLDLTLDSDQSLRAHLRAAGGDTVMRDVQDAFFDRVYWQPAVTSAKAENISTALGTAVVYDSRVHGSWGLIRDRVRKASGTIGPGVKESDWIAAYVNARRSWLAHHSNELLRKTIYRMDAFQTLIAEGKWDLALPLRVRGITIDEARVSGPPLQVSAEVAETRLLKLRTPFMQGADVRAVQEAVIAAGVPGIDADGVFGPATEKAVKAFQIAKGLVGDGIVGPSTLAEFGL